MKRARNKVLTENQHANVQRYTRLTAGQNGPFHYDVSDLPEETVSGLTAYNMWLFGEELRNLGRLVLEAAPAWLRRMAGSVSDKDEADGG
jgi:hypothetical protein